MYQLTDADKAKLATDTGEVCPQCERDLIWKHGKFGVFKACSGFPRCKWKHSTGPSPKTKPAVDTEPASEYCTASVMTKQGTHLRCSLKTHYREVLGASNIHQTAYGVAFVLPNGYGQGVSTPAVWLDSRRSGVCNALQAGSHYHCSLAHGHDGDHWACTDRGGAAFLCHDDGKYVVWNTDEKDDRCPAEHEEYGACKKKLNHVKDHANEAGAIWSQAGGDEMKTEVKQVAVPAGDPGQALWNVIKTAAMTEIATGTAAVIKDLMATMPNKALVIEWKENDKLKAKVEGTYHKALPEVMDLFKAGLKNVMLVGPAGSGKTTLAKDLAKALKLQAVTLSCTAGMPEWHLTGRSTPNLNGGPSKYTVSPMVTAYENGGVGLCDEMDACDPNTLITINAAMANGHWSLPHREESPQAIRHEDFYWMGACNTFGNGANRQYVGRNQLDAATLDRFCCAVVEMDYDRDLETAIAIAYLGPSDGNKLLSKVWQIRERVEKLQFRRVVGTRAVENMAKLVKSGKDIKYALDRLLVGWTPDEKSKVL